MGLGGLTVPVPTLFDRDGKLSPGANADFARALCTEGVDHLLVLGSTGEFPLLEDAERTELVRSVSSGLSSPCDLWVGCGAPATSRAVRYAKEAEEHGASALLAVAPYYLRPTYAEIAQYYREIHAAVKIPLLAYNIPAKVGYALPSSLVHELAGEGVIVGMKDTSGSIESIERFLAAAPHGFQLLPGDDQLVEDSIARGAVGAVMGTANVVPRLAQGLVAACRRGDAARAAELQDLVARLKTAVGHGPYPSTTKFLAHHVRGATVGYRSPYGPLTDREEAAVLAAWSEVEAQIRPFL